MSGFKLLRDADVPIAPVYSLDEVFNDPQIQYRKVIEEVEHPEIGKVRVLRIPVEFSENPFKNKRACAYARSTH